MRYASESRYYIASRFSIILPGMLAKLKGDTEIWQILQFCLFQNDPTFKRYFTAIIIIFDISLDQKINLYNNTKNVFTN